ncbi:hypothetical protein HELRODRAFT_182011 [Helobdella robusta]|uniref:DUF7044 domain-containing protein n=1 Tax=Helobdella robusta TaxID=6412 RepID=T1FHL3_HELRO|nr:hypothetical protein HELRODRAFT_182011 [Helobdella robusta]ESN91837.1 hypothetical protein HELRODRAFT_182011 [Helobdella robusta]
MSHAALTRWHGSNTACSKLKDHHTCVMRCLRVRPVVWHSVVWCGVAWCGQFSLVARRFICKRGMTCIHFSWGACKFPSRWRGRWREDDVIVVVISALEISNRGLCYEVYKDSYLIENRNNYHYNYRYHTVTTTLTLQLPLLTCSLLSPPDVSTLICDAGS